MDPDPEAQKHADPQHCRKAMYLTIRGVGRQLRRIIEHPKHQLQLQQLSAGVYITGIFRVTYAEGLHQQIKDPL
jgi:hypothetical protein